MPKQKWRVVVAKLGASNVLHESQVEANNWMSALRAARQAMSERPSVPPGASCSIDAQGVATVLDPVDRRKFVLSPVAFDDADNAPMQPAAPAQTPAAEPPAQARAHAQAPTAAKKKAFQTVAMIPDKPAAPRAAIPVTGPTESQASAHSIGMQGPVQAPTSRKQSPGEPSAESATAPRAPEPVAAAPQRAAPSPDLGKKGRFQTVGFAERIVSPAHPSQSPAHPSQSPARPSQSPARPSQSPARPSHRPRGESGPIGTSSRPRIDLELLLERNDDPSADNPLCYRERAYLVPKGTTVAEAEAALRWKLEELRQSVEGPPRGKFLNFAVFDHRWNDLPERPPVVVLQWRDWRGDVCAEYPAAARVSSLPPPNRPHEDHIAEVFEALEALPRLRTPAEALDFVVRLLESTMPSEAISACLYDINTDELRFVALAGTGADRMQGHAVPRAAGLFGQAVRAEDRASVFADVRVEPAFNPEIDGRPGLDPRNALLRPVTYEHQLLGMLQLINRSGSEGFSAQDVNAINYIGERLAEFLQATRSQRRPLA